uniref:RdRp n=1 Tax=viral metagenome TaxID=1070528 RepID=A0A2V0RI89_9ZZZZ
MGTVADSTLGRGIHFLQKHYIGGQIISRRVAYDHEKEVAGQILCGDVSSYLTKAKLLASRGGNLDGLNMLQLLTIINGSRSTQFGRQAKVSFDSMAAPGGLTNQIILGFSNDNSRLFLELNAVPLFGDVQVEINKRPSFEVPITTGRRVLSRHEDTVAKVNVGGAQVQATVRDLLASSENRLLDPSRKVTKTVSSHVSAFYSKEYIQEVSYNSSVRGSAAKAIGESLQTRSLRPKFIERALQEVGLIGDSLTATPVPEMKKSSTHTGFKYNDKRVIFGYSEFYMKLPLSMEPGEDKFIVYDRNGTVHEGLIFDQIWHPFYGLPINYRLMCSLFGMTTAKSSAYDVKSYSGIFSPDRFRKDITKEEVIAIVKKTRYDQVARDEMLSLIGFNEREIGAMESQILNIESFEDVEEAAEYSSIPEVMKCLSSYRIQIIMMRCFPNFAGGYFASAPPSLRTMIFSHFLALISDEMNVCTSLGGTPTNPNRYIRIPAIDIIDDN